MHLLSALASGIAGAPSGTAEIFARGTNTRATYFTDFEGDSQVSTGADVQLDANGGASVYVNQLVTVVVKDVRGAKVRQWVDGYASPNTEVRSLSFTGTDYTSAQVLAGNPTTLQTVLDRWETSAGAVDWEVLVGGTPTSIEDAVGAVGDIFVNVKSSVFGAVGDGVTDDTLAIVAAFAFAGIGGATVVFPPGTYRITSSITVPTNVAIMGAGSGATFISMDDPTTNAFVFGVSANGYQVVRGFTFKAPQTCSGSAIRTSVASFISVQDCEFDGALLQGDFIFSSSITSKIVVSACTLNIKSGTTQTAVSSSGGYLVMNAGTRVHVTAGSQTTPMVLIGDGTITGCIFDDAAVTTLTPYSGVKQAGGVAGTRVMVTGNRFSSIGTAAFTAIEAGIVFSSDILVESNNTIGGGVGGGGGGTFTLYGGTINHLDFNFSSYLGSRVGRSFWVNQNSGTLLTIDPLNFGVYRVEITDANAFTFNLTTTLNPPDGAEFELMLNNILGVTTGLGTFGTGMRVPSGTTTISLLANAWRTLTFVFRDTQWLLASDSGDVF